jgi:hypothetical protein
VATSVCNNATQIHFIPSSAEVEQDMNMLNFVLNFNLTLSNPIFLPPAYSPDLIYFGRERGWWVTCNYLIVLKDKTETERVQPALSVG